MKIMRALCAVFVLGALTLACGASATPWPPSPPTPTPSSTPDVQPTTEAAKDAASATRSPAPTRVLIGKWLDQAPPMGFGGTITIYQTSSGYDMNQKFPDGSSIKRTLVETTISGKKALLDPSTEQYQEYYVIDSQGNLGMYDSEGFIRTAKSTN